MYKCPKCGGAEAYTQQVQSGSRLLDFNPTDSKNLKPDIIPDYMQTPGQSYITPMMRTIVLCKKCPTPVEMVDLNAKSSSSGCVGAFLLGIVIFVGIMFLSAIYAGF
jgi:hypothetical protein